MIDLQSTIRDPRSSGFTLIEMVITIVLLTVISAIAAVIILQGVKGYSAEESRSNLHYQARLAVERMARDVRSIQSCTTTVIFTTQSNRLSFILTSGETVTFDVASNVLTRNSNILATGITSAQTFSYLNSAGIPATACSGTSGLWFIDISVTDAQGSEIAQMRTRVHPMNF